MPPILYLIDGHALAYRTFYAITGGSSERLQTRAGEPTAGVLGFASVLLRLLEQDKPEYLAVAFDTGKTFRDELFPEYKATRAKMPDDLRTQMDRIRQLVDAFHFPRLEMEGFEADDVLGTIAKQAVEKGLGVKILTGDRDLLQLVGERVIVSLAGAKLSEAKDFTPPEVSVYLGVRPDQVVDYKALVGDPSDNIPGVKGIGEKTAVSLLAQYPTLDDIYAHIEELPARIKTRLEADREMAYKSQTLAQIRTDLKIVLNLDEARTDHVNYPAVEALFRELEFRNLIARLQKMAAPSSADSAALPVAPQQLSLFGAPVRQVGAPQNVDINVRVIDSPAALAQLAGELSGAPVIALDTETTSTDPMRAELVGISLAYREGEGIYIPVAHRDTLPQLPIEEVIAALAPALTNPRIPKIGHNLKYDALMLLRNGLEINPVSFDTMIAEWLVDPSSHRLGLKDMAEDYLAVSMTHIEELIGKGKNQLSMADVSIASAAPYAAADAEVTFRLQSILAKRMAGVNAASLFEQIEMPLIPVLAQMELNGIALDIPFFQKMSGELTTRMAEIEQQITRAVGYTFNLNSTQQLSKVLFETLRLQSPEGKKTASGHYSTSADVLLELSGQHPVVDWILEYRELSKLKSTYVEALPLQVNPRTGRVHTSFNQTGSVTGRLASSDPNLQNIPTRTELGRRVRQGFIAAPGMLLLSVDYSQVELRIVAHMAHDEAMLSAFRAGQDIHAATAAAILGIPLDQVNKDQRRRAKAINFGLIYGMSAFGLSHGTDLTLAEAENFVKAYFQQFPGVKAFLDNLRRLATSQGYVETLFGRRRYFPNLHSQTNPNFRAREEREAINAPIQGTAADLVKVAMIQLPPALKAEGLHARMLLQVHDELVFEVPEAELKSTVPLVQRIMSGAAQLDIPLSTEARCGQNWGALRVISPV